MIAISLIALVAIALLMVRYLIRSRRAPTQRRRWIGDFAYLVYTALIVAYSGSMIPEAQTTEDQRVFTFGLAIGIGLLGALISVRLTDNRRARSRTAGVATQDV